MDLKSKFISGKSIKAKTEKKCEDISVQHNLKGKSGECSNSETSRENKIVHTGV